MALTDERTTETEPEGLIREARRRARRRRARWALSGLLLAGVALGAFGAFGAGRNDGRAPRDLRLRDRTRPFVDARAFAGEGDLAFVSRGALWLLDAGSGRLRRLPVPAGLTASSPTFSPDGRWLAYLVSRGSPDAASTFELWLASANGTGAHLVRTLGTSVTESIGWSPASDVLAVIVQRRVHFDIGWAELAARVDLVRPDGTVRQLFGVPRRAANENDSIWGALWSPDGRRLAVATSGPTVGSAITAMSVVGPARATTWFSIRKDERLPGTCPGLCGTEVIADPAGWWRGRGIGFWAFSGGMVHNLDATPLEVIGQPGARPRVIGETLSDGITDAVDAAPDGALAIVASTENAGREYADGKAVEVCPSGRIGCKALAEGSVWHGPGVGRCYYCRRQPRPGSRGSGVSLDPSWSPSGGELAYVKAPVDLTAAWPDAAWYATHRLYVWNARTGRSRQLDGTDGAELPTWSRDGHELLYVAGDGLWLARPATAARPIEIEHPLFAPKQWRAVASSAGIAFYGQIPWSAQFSWSSP